MNEYPSLILPFVLGVLTSALIGWLLHKRSVSGLLLSNSSCSDRLHELEAQLTRQSDEFSKQLTQRVREHMEELDQLARQRRQVDETHLAETKTKVREAEDRGYQEGKRQAELRADEQSKAFSVTVRPFIRKIRNDSILKKLNQLEVGYQYQLQINGIPCFDPHVVIEQRYEEKEVNQEVIDKMTNIALEAAKTAVAQLGPASALIPIASTPVIEALARRK